MNFAIMVEIGVLLVLTLLYWQLIFHLISQILIEKKLKKIYKISVSVANIIIPFIISDVITAPNTVFITMFVLMILEFWLLYKSTFTQNIFCALSSIIHVFILHTLVTGIFSVITGYTVYQISTITFLRITSLIVIFAALDIAIVLVLKLLPLEQVRIINLHKEPQLFLIAWMTIFNIYLLYNSCIAGEQIATSLVVLIGLYIVVLFAIKIVRLLGYKEKSDELTQTMLQEQQYRNTITKDAIASYVINVTNNTITQGFDDHQFGTNNLVSSYSDLLTFTANKIIHSDDLSKFIRYVAPDNLLREFEHGNSEIVVEYRRLTVQKDYIWVRTVVNLLREIGTGDLIAYVYIKDINKEKLRQLELQYMAERDPLTGLYNKEITGKLVNENLIDNGDLISSILFMIDIDNFKSINDHLSHAFGDAVLCELSDRLRSIFRRDDIIGRIGGDEYIAYIKNSASTKIAEEKAQEICNAFLITYKGLHNEEYTISGSIGIATAPKDGHSFEDLYKHADAALYKAKNAGKSKYQFYDGSDFYGYESNRTEIQADGLVIQKSFKQNRIEYVFKILYQCQNPVEAINSVLELVSNHFCFERGYIFETNKDGKTTSNTFEWCTCGVTAQIENLQNLSIDVISVATESFYKTGTYIVKTLNALNQTEHAIWESQGINSMFQFGIFDKCQLIGFIGFNNCTNDALPSNTEIDEIATICNVLATFLVKQRADETASKDLQVRQEVMNHLNNFVYVITPKTFQVLFMNEQTQKQMHNLETNTPCYKFFRGNDEQCDDCPINKLDQNLTGQNFCEIYNKKLGIWLETKASILHWTDGSLAYLIESADITKQKEEHLRHIKQLEDLVFVDELTGTRTFCKFKKDAKQILESRKYTTHLLVKLDIDNFKLINQLYGYEKGDEILRCVSLSIEQTTQNEDDIFARISNDEFVALFTVQDISTISNFYDVFLNNFNTLIDKDFSFKCTFSYGVYLIKSNDMQTLDIKDLFEKVNIAHKAAKLDKFQKFIVYDESMTQKALRTKEIEDKMENALKCNEFIIYLQPKYYLDTEMVGGAEALSRWQNGNNDLFFPSAFIPVFERNGFITKLDFYVLHKVCCVIKSWIINYIEPVVVSINFSRLHLSNPNFVKELCEIVDNVGINRKYIEVEITETAIYDNINTLEILLAELHQNGFNMSMDDFGSGYSSLGMLKDLPVDIIKMDRSFFANQKDVERSKIVVGSIIEMAAELGIHIVAEGVEEQQHIELLRELHCDMVQGYYYAKPMSTESFTELIRTPIKFKI